MPPTGPAAYRQQSPHAGSMSPAHPVGGLTPHTGALVAPGGFGAGSPAGLPPRPAALPVPAAATHVTFATHAEAEAAFKGMLRNLGVTSTWTWEMVMKEAITEPLYKALKTLAERKAAFEKYLVEERERERQERDKSLARCRKDWFKAMDKLGGGVLMEDGVKSWWSWERGKRVMREKCKDVWSMPKNDEERKILFDEYIAKLRKDEEVRRLVRSSLPFRCADKRLCRLGSARPAAATWTSSPASSSLSSSTSPGRSAGKTRAF